MAADKLRLVGHAIGDLHLRAAWLALADEVAAMAGPSDATA